MGELFTAVSDPAKLKDHEAGIRSQMSELITQIADIEEEAVSAIRSQG
jgi:hypothetical protein